MNRTTINIKKSILIIGVLLSFACLAYGQQVGDIRTTGTATTNSATNWQKWNGAIWVALSQSPASLSPISANVQLNHAVTVDASVQIIGAIANPNDKGLTISSGATFTVGSGGSYQLSLLTVSAGGRFINNGSITGQGQSPDIFLSDGLTPGTGGILENNRTINISGKLNVGKFARVISGSNGVIGGTGNLIVHNEGAGFVIANSQGYPAAIRLTGNQSIKNASFTFNGTGSQITGFLPEPVYNLTVANGTNLTLSEDIEMVTESQAHRGDPTFKVEGGATLDIGNHLITTDKNQTHGDTKFILEANATIRIAHADGISSDKTNSNTIKSGSIRTYFATYSDAANYVYYGNQSNPIQFSGCFVTSPTPNLVHDFTVLNTNGLRLCPNFQPLYYNGQLTGGDYIATGPPATHGTIQQQTLPVTLSYFNACFNGFDSVTLRWETQSETNNLGFYVLRSVELDATQANVVSALVPAANSSQGASYYFEDVDLYEDGLYYYWLQDVSFTGEVELHGPAMAQVSLQGGFDYTPDIPLQTSLIRNFPNPFNPSTQLEYYLENSADVDFEVYNLKGQLVDHFTLRHQTSGFHRHKWEPQLESGVYLVKFSAEGRSNVRKVILTK